MTPVAFLDFVVPGEPVPCSRARTVRLPNGAVSTFTPSKTREYEHRVSIYALAAIGRQGWRITPDDGVAGYELDVLVYRSARRGDWDNFGKAVADALTKARVWPDDRYVLDGRVRLYVDKANPRTEVRVRLLAAEARAS